MFTHPSREVDTKDAAPKAQNMFFICWILLKKFSQNEKKIGLDTAQYTTKENECTTWEFTLLSGFFINLHTFLHLSAQK